MALILIVAMFNSVGAIIILIVEKRNSIQTLLKLGATKKTFKAFFLTRLNDFFFWWSDWAFVWICFVSSQKAYSLYNLLELKFLTL